MGRRLLLIPLLPFVGLYALFLVLVVFPMMVVVIGVCRVIDRLEGWRVRRAVRGVGRCATWEDVGREAAAGVGTLITERPALGWPDLRIWWVREAISGAGGPPSPGDLSECDLEARLENPQYDRWCVEEFTDRARGRALLVECAYGNRASGRVMARVERLCAANPTLERAEVWSGRLDEREASTK